MAKKRRHKSASSEIFNTFACVFTNITVIMEIVGKIIQVLEPRRGTSSRTGSEWICGQYVLETEDQYPKKVFFEVFGDDRIKQFNIQMGERLEVSIDIDAREYNGRWFNSVRAFRVNRNIQPVGAAAGYAAQSPDMPPFGQPAQPAQPAGFGQPMQGAAPAAGNDDLPF